MQKYSKYPVAKIFMRGPVGVAELYRGQDFDIRLLSRMILCDTSLKTSNNGAASCRKWCRFLLWTEYGYIATESWIKGINSITVASKSDCESPSCSSRSPLLFSYESCFLSVFQFLSLFFYFSFPTFVSLYFLFAQTSFLSGF